MPRVLNFAAAALAMAMASTTAAQTTPLTSLGWALVTATDDAFVYMKAEGAPAGGLPRIWTAYDLDTAGDRDGFSFRSVKSLSEYDCPKRRARILRETFHSDPALAGKEWAPEGFVVTDWAEAPAGSVGEKRMDFACPLPLKAS